MPQPAKGARLGGSAAHEKLLLANLAKSLFEHGRITTTEAKARRLRPVAERLITKAKKGDIHNRRQVLATITDKGALKVKGDRTKALALNAVMVPRLTSKERLSMATRPPKRMVRCSTRSTVEPSRAESISRVPA